MIEKCTSTRSKIQANIDSINNRIMQKKIAQAGVEIKAAYNLDEVWSDYLYVLNGILYRWDKCILKLKEILEMLEEFTIASEAEGQIFIGAFQQCNELSYEFENLLVSFAKLYEEPLLVEVSRHLSKTEQQKFRKCCPQRDDENGLFWEMNLLRNRAAHSTPGFYTMHQNYSARYMSISSKIRGIEYMEGKFVFVTQLLSLRKNDYIKGVIRKQIIEEESNIPLLELLFESNTPKGKGKKNPQVLFMSNVSFFDLNEEFLELTLDMFKLIENQIDIFERNI